MEPVLRQRVVAIYFRQTSTRTRTSFSAAALRLGAQIVTYGPNDLQTNTGETYRDTGRVLATMVDALVARTAGDPQELRDLAAQDTMPVVNAMTSDEHPTQAIADLATLLQHFGRIEKLRVLYVGEGNNTAAALALALARFPGNELFLRTPAGYGVPDDKLRLARARAAASGSVVEQAHDLAALPETVDAVYTTRWRTTGTTKPDPDWQDRFRPFQVNGPLMERWPEARFMHDLPAHRGEEVTADVLDGPASLALPQAANKYHTALAILEWCLGGPRCSAVGPVRVSDYRHLTVADRQPPGPGVFFDPVDTEVGIWATVDLLGEESIVLDLGSGSGAAAAAVARAGAAHVHGVDVSEASVRWAAAHYALDQPTRRVSFGVADYTALSPAALLDHTPLAHAPDVVASNPPYVPVPPVDESSRVSIDGGTDGLRLVRVVMGHAEALGSDLALTIGSYSSPRQAASLLAGCGYGIAGLTLAALRLGDYTRQHMERVLHLEATGEGPLLRPDDGPASYLVVGLSCRRRADPTTPGAPDLLSPDDLLKLLDVACRSRTTRLETLDDPSLACPVPLRVLVLPDEEGRHHC